MKNFTASYLWADRCHLCIWSLKDYWDDNPGWCSPADVDEYISLYVLRTDLRIEKSRKLLPDIANQ